MPVRPRFLRIRKSIQENKKEKVNMKDRLINKGLVTSILGVIVLVFCGVLIYQGKQTAGDLSGWMTLAMVLLRAKDSLLFGEQVE